MMKKTTKQYIAAVIAIAGITIFARQGIPYNERSLGDSLLTFGGAYALFRWAS